MINFGYLIKLNRYLFAMKFGLMSLFRDPNAGPGGSKGVVKGKGGILDPSCAINPSILKLEVHFFILFLFSLIYTSIYIYFDDKITFNFDCWVITLRRSLR